MSVIKRTGNIQKFSSSKLKQFFNRIKGISPSLHSVDVELTYDSINKGLTDQISSDDMLKFLSSSCAALSTQSYDYSVLAGRIEMVNLYKVTPDSFTDAMNRLKPILDSNFLEKVNQYDFDQHIVEERDFTYDIIGVKTLQRSYLLKDEKGFVERPQYMLMRVAVFLGDTPEEAVKTYDFLSRKYYTHATPTLFHSGMKRHQLASCFLMTMKDDSIDGIFDTVKNAAKISKSAGGIGFSVSNIRAKGSPINGTNGHSSGLVPMLRVFNNTARYVDQCLTPNTIVYTTGKPTEIQHLVDGESLVHENGAENVSKILEHDYNGPLIHIKTLNSIENLCITPEHPVFALKDLGKSYNFTLTKQKIIDGSNVPSWYDVKELKVRDFIGTPIPDYEKDFESISADDCYFYGIVLGDGCISNGSQKITLHTVRKDFIKNWVLNYFHSNCTQYHINIDGNTTVIRWNKNVNLPIRHGDVYFNKEKHVHHKWLHLPIAKAKYILKGLVDTDGSKGKELQFDSTSRNLIESVKYLLLRMGVLCSGYKRDRRGESHETDRGTITNKKISYVVRIPKVMEIASLFGITPGKFTKYFRHENILYTRIQNIRSSNYNGVLYDLQFEKDHSYITHNGLVHNGGGKRKGSFAVFIEPWHADVQDVLKLKLNHGVEEERARDLFYSMWIPDIFMKRVESDGDWALFCPTKVPGLQDAYGPAFDSMYEEAEKANLYKTTIKARVLWNQILDTQIETGTPYLMYKDACNMKSNQSNLGTIRSSNLCAEVVQYSNKNEVSVCTLASICLPKCTTQNGFDFNKLAIITSMVTKNLNKVVDKTSYPLKETLYSNTKNRPIGIGVQGLADVFQLMGIAYDSKDAADLNTKIFETIYYNALKTSSEIAKTQGTYQSFQNCPAHLGKLQFDLWNHTPTSMYDWESLKQSIKTHGLRNSLLVACMPTASTAQINGNTESFEPRTSNLYVRRVLSGEFVIMNRYLESACRKINRWDKKLIDNIITNKGSIQNTDLPQEMKNTFKTVWEMSQKSLIDLSVGRAPYVCQSQSLNLYISQPTRNVLTSMHFYAWKQGLKTGMYYLRTKPKSNAIAFTACESCSA